MKFKKLFIPGPTEVRKEVLDRMAWPLIGHRGGDFAELFNRVTPKLKKFLNAEHHVFISTSASTGVMEGAVLNCVEERCLNVTCGAFGERWHEIDPTWGRSMVSAGHLEMSVLDALALVSLGKLKVVEITTD